MKHTLLLITALLVLLLASCATTKAELTNITLNGKNYLDMRFTDAEGAPISDLECDISVEFKGSHYGKIKARTDESGRVSIKKIPKSTGYCVFLSPAEKSVCAQIQFNTEKSRNISKRQNSSGTCRRRLWCDGRRKICLRGKVP